MEATLDLLGWRFKKVGPKAPDFQAEFDALGVHIDLTGIVDAGGLHVANKPERAEKVEAVFRDIEKAGLIRAPTA
eukprot:5748910-Heterocapsa_arctica.AAC.1